MRDSDFPSYFQAADAVSISSQKTYLQLNRWNLILIVVATTFGSLCVITPKNQSVICIFVGLALIGSVILTIIIRVKKFEDIWYDGRALAESCKTLSWRFMCKSELFEDSVHNNVEQVFIGRVKELFGKFDSLYKELNAETLSKPIISERMKKIRSLSLSERKAYYIKHRIDEQISWYARKAEYNKRKYSLLSNLIIVTLVLAVVFVVMLLLHPNLSSSVIGLLTTVATSLFSWLQIKQHQELKRAYTVTVEELNVIRSLVKEEMTEKEFSQFVLDSENAMSREHTLWLAQRRR